MAQRAWRRGHDTQEGQKKKRRELHQNDFNGVRGRGGLSSGWRSVHVAHSRGMSTNASGVGLWGIVLSHRRGKAQAADTGGSSFISPFHEEERSSGAAWPLQAPPGPKLLLGETHWPLLTGLKTVTSSG